MWFYCAYINKMCHLISESVFFNDQLYQKIEENKAWYLNRIVTNTQLQGHSLCWMNKEQGVLSPVLLEFILDNTSESTLVIHTSGNSVLYSTVYTIASMTNWA